MFPHPLQCDKFYECKGGNVTETLCPDGLVFDEKFNRTGKCDHPFTVECGNRTLLQPAQRTSEFCARKNGVFYHPDKTLCDTFMTCDDGEHKEGVCVDGLHFDEPTGTCVWPHIAARENCKERAKVLEDGFSCPKDKKDQNGETVSHPHYAHPTNCEMFYVCLNGVEPRLLQCENLGEVFNDYTLVCDAPANVSGCEDWFD